MPERKNDPSSPPRLAAWLVRRWVASHRQQQVADDLEELFALRAEREGLRRARWLYWRDVASIALRRSLRHPRKTPPELTYEQARGPMMLTNYLKVAVRTLRRHAGYTGINVAGLAVGMTACLLIALYVQDELRYDRYHQHADRIYRAVLDLNTPASTRPLTTTPAALAPTLLENIPEVEQAVRFYKPTSATVEYGEQQFREEAFFFADERVFDVFTFTLREGDVETALSEPYSIVLTESTAQTYFGTADPVGELLTVNDTLQFEVTGVAQDPPRQSHFHFDFLASFSSWERMVPSLVETWAPHMYYTYVKMPPSLSAEDVEQQLPDLVDRSVDLSEGWSFRFQLQPLTQIHLHSHREGELEANGRIEYIYMFSAIGLFILLLACINFMNLATARSSRRAREVGMRKVLGAQRRQLIGQFLGEALLLSFVSLVFALVLVWLALPAFNDLADKSLTFGVLAQGPYVLALAGLGMLVGVMAGSYPAFVLSAARPLETVKGTTQVEGWRSARMLRKGLVAFQFAVSVFLIAGTGIVFKQLAFMRHQDLRFEPEQVVVLSSLEGQQLRQFETLKAELLQHTSVRDVTASSSVPGRGMITFSYQAEGMADDEWNTISVLFADPDFMETYQVNLIAGRDVDRERATDSTQAFLLNEATVAKLGWTPEEAIGRRFALRRGSGRIVGVVEDFHYASLQHAVEPLAIVANPVAYSSAPLYVSLRVAADDLSSTLATVEDTWRSVVANRPFEYFFLDDDFDRQYRAEERLSRLFGVFTGLAILIACLGLFGLAAFSAEQRSKEIGVRKVLGASVASIVLMLSKDIVRLVLIAFVVATPLAYVAMHRWLETFAYRIELSAWIFLMAGLLALAVALFTVSYQALRAALTNPVEVLRDA